jgi:hypothetical protein
MSDPISDQPHSLGASAESPTNGVPLVKRDPDGDIDPLRTLAALLASTIHRLEAIEKHLAHPTAVDRPPPPKPLATVTAEPANLPVVPSVSLKAHLRTFSGRDYDSVDAWLTQFAALVGLTSAHTGSLSPSLRAILLSHLDGDAYLCVSHLPLSASFAEISTHLTLYFPERTLEAAVTSFGSLQQTEDIDMHVRKFRTLYDETLARGSNPSSDVELALKFKLSLHPDLRKEVHCHRCSSLEDTIALARHLAPLFPPPTLLSTHTIPTGVRTKLSAEERTRCLTLGLCMYCRQPGHAINECPRRPASRTSPDAATGLPGNVSG